MTGIESTIITAAVTMLVAIVVAASITIGLISLGLVVSAARKSSSAVKSKPSRLISFTTSAPPADTTKVVLGLVQHGRYEADEILEDRDRIVLSEPPTLAPGRGWGFFYPIYLTERGDGGTLVEIGIKSKLVQVGPIPRRAHERFANRLKSALLAEGAVVS